MPKKRLRNRERTRDIERIEERYRKRKEREERTRRIIDITQLNTRLRIARIHRNTIEFRYVDRYRLWYEHYRNIKFKVTEAKAYWTVPKVKLPDYTSKVEVLLKSITNVFTRFPNFLRELTLQIIKDLINYSPIGMIRAIHDAYILYRTSRELRKGVTYAPIVTVWKDRFVEIYIDRSIEEWLRDPQRFPATVEMLGMIARQLLATKYTLVIPPDQLETWNAIIKLLFEYYVSYTRKMPCRRTQMMIRLRPITLHVMRGLGVRMYVVRWLRRENMSSPFLYADRAIDVHFRALMKYKYYGEVISTMIVGGDTDKLTGDEFIPTWRDVRQLPRDIIKIIDAFYQWWKFTDGLARSIGRPEMSNSLGDCSIYISVRPRKNWLKRSIRRIERDYWKECRWD